jgi:hypothetical protein
MSVKSQQANMKRLAQLLSKSLAYIYGERESGPNGAKAEFHARGRAFLRALAKDLKLREYKVHSNYAGIAVSGEVYLYGMWSDGNGLMVSLEQPCIGNDVVLYRRIQNMNDHSGRMNSNHFISLSALRSEDYHMLLGRLLRLRQEVGYERAA